jgi:hypothetical protein
MCLATFWVIFPQAHLVTLWKNEALFNNGNEIPDNWIKQKSPKISRMFPRFKGFVFPKNSLVVAFERDHTIVFLLSADKRKINK